MSETNMIPNTEASEASDASEALEAPAARAAWRPSHRALFLRVFFGRKLVIFGSIIIAVFVLTAIFAPLLAPYGPYEQNLDMTLAKVSLQHPLGTDTLGRDTLSRLIYGARTSLLVGFVAVGVASLIGLTLGALAGSGGRRVHAVIMRIIDMQMAFPFTLLALTLAALLGGGLKNVIIALGISMIPPYARVMCAQTASIKERDYIRAQRSMGAGRLRTLLRHIAPNALPPMIVLMTMQLGTAILAEAGLSFLGIGIQPPGCAWGAMVSEGYRYLASDAILSIAPGLSIMIVVFAFNMVGDGLRDAIDPRLRGTLSWGATGMKSPRTRGPKKRTPKTGGSES
jgi:peptide/nickel transport system permease protein